MQRQEGRGLTFRAWTQWFKPFVMWMADEIFANLGRVTGEDH